MMIDLRAHGTYLKKWLSAGQGMVVLALGGCLLWAYAPVVAGLIGRWSREDVYAHGFLVPGFAICLLWLRREKLQSVSAGYHWGGLAILLAGALMRLAGAYIYFEFLEAFSFLVCLTGLVFFLGGKQALGWAWPALGFLIFMIPLPFRVETAAALPLQRLATKASTYLLQTLGVPAFAEGNVIHLREARLGIVEACNGLGMLVSFVALSTALAILIKRPMLDKVIIVLSAVPIALAANVLRITFTGILHETAGSAWADLFFHDLGGWLMMPVALALLWLELKVLSRLLVAPNPEEVGSALAPFILPKHPVVSPAHPEPLSSRVQGETLASPPSAEKKEKARVP
jgi:exosortase